MAVPEKVALELVHLLKEVYLEPEADIKVMPSEEYTGGEGGQVIIWEGGPEQWSIIFSAMVREGRIEFGHAGLLLEPVNHCVLGMYEA